MSLESFYGGRMGASFVIVKTFDGIDIPQNSGNYKVVSLAIAPESTKDNVIYLYDDSSSSNYHFVEKNADNYKNYVWKLTKLDGSSVTIKSIVSGIISTDTLTSKEAEGMVQLFKKGGETTNEVNYGEYVIIDTPDKRNPDNGKVYRRGMDYQNSLGGAEYIGQIVGPQGEAPELFMDHYDNIPSPYKEENYTARDGDLISGSYIDSSTGSRKFNDAISWRYATLEDDYGNVEGCVLGFKIPTLTLNYDAQSIDAYDENYRVKDGEKQYHYEGLVKEDVDDPDGYDATTGTWKHPFYQKWQIKIPQGYHGIDSTEICVVHTKTKPAGFQPGYAGTQLYEDAACINQLSTVLVNSIDIIREAEGQVYDPQDPDYVVLYDPDPAVISCKVNYNGTIRYVKKSDCYMDMVRYRETDYIDQAEGKYTYHYINTFNHIIDIDLEEDGSIVVSFSGKETPEVLRQTLTWINDMSLSDDGYFEVTFNNDRVHGGIFQKRINWIDKVEMLDDGTINFYYNTDHINPAYTHTYAIKFIDNIYIETIAQGEVLEGTGTQKLSVEYNTGEVESIGNPLNYIIETVISTKSVAYPDAPYSHLLVYYSDPNLRQSMSDKWVRYPSTKYAANNIIWDEWVDLGPVKGVAGGIHILKNVENLNELYDEIGQAIPPEQLTDDQGQYIDPEAAGWVVTLTEPGIDLSTLYCYDYEKKNWYSIGTIDISASNPATVLVKSLPTENQMPDPDDVLLLNEGGFWLASQTVYFAE